MKKHFSFYIISRPNELYHYDTKLVHGEKVTINDNNFGIHFTEKKEGLKITELLTGCCAGFVEFKEKDSYEEKKRN